MLYTTEQLKAAIAKLDAARRTFACQAARVDAAGGETFEGADGSAVKYGTHDAAFIGIDLDTGEVRCRVCANEHQHADKPKKVGKVGKRTQLVSA